MLQFSRPVQLGEEKTHVHSDSYATLSALDKRYREMNIKCGGEGRFRIRTAEKAGKTAKSKSTIVYYPEMIKRVDKLPFDKSDYKYTYVKMRVSTETEPEIEEWPYFIHNNQRWDYHCTETGDTYFLDTDGKWYKGEYDADHGEWKRV